MCAGPGEMFGFLEITIEFPIRSEPRQAWIYIPHDSPHRNNRFHVEVLSVEIKGIAYGSRCRINLPRGNAQADCIVVWTTTQRRQKRAARSLSLGGGELKCNITPNPVLPRRWPKSHRFVWASGETQQNTHFVAKATDSGSYVVSIAVLRPPYLGWHLSVEMPQLRCCIKRSSILPKASAYFRVSFNR